MARIKWYDPPTQPDGLYRKLVRQPGVGKATKRQANKMAVLSKAILARHHANNINDPRADSYIETEQGTGGVDAFVKLVDPDGAAFQIEHETKALRGAVRAV